MDRRLPRESRRADPLARMGPGRRARRPAGLHQAHGVDEYGRGVRTLAGSRRLDTGYRRQRRRALDPASTGMGPFRAFYGHDGGRPREGLGLSEGATHLRTTDGAGLPLDPRRMGP